MKKRTITLGALGAMVLGCSVSLIAGLATVSPLQEFGYDAISNLKGVSLKEAASTGELEYSDTYVQYAYGSDNLYYVRFATAVKGEAIKSLSYTRAEVIGSDATVYAAKDVEISAVYSYLLANGEKTYYNGSQLVKEESEETKDYYWACLTIKFNDSNCYASDINVKFNINEDEVELERTITLEQVVSTNDSAFSDVVSRYDEEYHYYSCLSEGLEYLERKESHNTDEHIDLVEPTLTQEGHTAGAKCSTCGGISSGAATLPVLSEEHYNISYETNLVDDIVCDTIVYTLKDTSIGEYEFVVVGDELKEYIHAGTSYYSINRWNELFSNQTSTVVNGEKGKELTITLKEGTTTVITASDGVSNLDGMLDLTLYNKVTVTGNGTLNISYSVLQDGILANTFIVDEGATVDLIGFSSEDKSGIKVLDSLIINGTFNISNFGYGQPIVKDGGKRVTTTIGEKGHFNINNVITGIRAWSTGTVAKPIINVYGKLTVNNASSHGLDFGQIESTINLFGNSETYVSAKGCALYHFDNLYVGDGEKGQVQNNAKVTFISSGDNVIYSRKDSKDGRSINVVFNTRNTVLIESTIGDNSKTGIQIANKSIDLLQISCYDMTIKGCNNALGKWTATSGKKMVYVYDTETTSKLKVENCKNLFNAGNYGNDEFYGALAVENAVERL